MQVTIGGGLALGDSVVTLLLRQLTHTRERGAEPDGLRGMVGDVRHDAQPVADRPARWRAHSLRRVPGPNGTSPDSFRARPPARVLSKSWFVWAFVVLILSRSVWPSPGAGRLPSLPRSRLWLLVASLVLFVSPSLRTKLREVHDGLSTTSPLDR